MSEKICEHCCVPGCPGSHCEICGDRECDGGIDFDCDVETVRRIISKGCYSDKLHGWHWLKLMETQLATERQRVKELEVNNEWAGYHRCFVCVLCGPGKPCKPEFNAPSAMPYCGQAYVLPRLEFIPISDKELKRRNASKIRVTSKRIEGE